MSKEESEEEAKLAEEVAPASPKATGETKAGEATEEVASKDAKPTARPIDEEAKKATADDEPASKKQKVDEKPDDVTKKTGEKAEGKEEVEAYKIDEPPEKPSTDDERIDSPAVVLFGLHPLVKEAPLSKLLETFGVLKSCSVRMAFASRYSSVEFETTEQAKAAYRALNNAKVMGKPVLVQPTVTKKN